MARAQEQAAFLIGERGLLELAEAEGRRIIDEASVAAGSVREGADDYALDILTTLEDEVTKALAGIQKGIGVLDDRRAELARSEAEVVDRDDDDGEDDEGDRLDDDGDARRSTYR